MHAVAAASDGPAATAERLRAALPPLLGGDLTAGPDRAKVLGWLRDVDVAFAPEDLPAPLASSRAAALAALGLPAQG